MSGFSMRNCPKCGNVFTYIRNPICKDCQEKEDEIFEIVRKYIKENPDKTITEVAEATDVTPKKIMKFIKDGKIDVSSSSIRASCEACGKPILAGRYCDSCAANITKGLTSGISKSDPNTPKKVAGKSIMYTQQKKKR